MDTNIFNLSYDILPPIFGGEKEKQAILNNGGNMKNILEEYTLYLGMRYRKKNSQIRYQDSAKKFLRFITELSEGEVQRYVIHLNQAHKPNTVTSEVVGLNRLLEYLKRPELRVCTPKWRMVPRDTITREQIVRLMEYARGNCRYMDYLILLMVRDCDCRNHEIIKTRWDWIHGDKILFQDCKTGDTIGRLTPDLKEALGHWRETTPYPENPFVFTVQKGPFKGQPLASNGWYVRSLVQRVSGEVIGRRLNPQDLRASVITAEHNAFVNPKIIQLKARHRSERTTQRYNHPSEQMIASYIESGTIFADNKEPVLKPKAEVREDKRGYINSICIPNLLETEDNSCFSFSYSFSFRVTSGKRDAGLVMGFFISPRIPAPSSPFVGSQASFVFGRCAVARTPGVFCFFMIFPPKSSPCPRIAPPRISSEARYLDAVVMSSEQDELLDSAWCSNHGQVMALGIQQMGVWDGY